MSKFISERVYKHSITLGVEGYSTCAVSVDDTFMLEGGSAVRVGGGGITEGGSAVRVGGGGIPEGGSAVLVGDGRSGQSGGLVIVSAPPAPAEFAFDLRWL